MSFMVNTPGTGHIRKATAVIRLAACALFAVLTPLAAHADVFGDTSQTELSFYFSVDGYGADSRFEEPSALALDEHSGLVYVADQKAGTVDAFSMQGVAKFQYGAKEGLKAPVGVAVDRSGNVYVSENAGGPIKIINSRGEVRTLDLPGSTASATDGDNESSADKDSADKPGTDKSSTEEPSADAQNGESAKPGSGRRANRGAVSGLNVPLVEAPKPGRLSFDRDGNLYVVDRANNQVYVFDKNLKYQFRFGEFGDKRGQFKLLQDVATDRQGRIYTVDAIGIPVQVFDRKGGDLFGFGVRGKGPESLSFPAAVFIDRNDQVWVVNKTQHCLKVFDRSGAFLRSFGNYGQGEGDLFYPIDAAEDSLGRVYVLEFGTRRLQVFTLRQPFEPFTP